MRHVIPLKHLKKHLRCCRIKEMRHWKAITILYCDSNTSIGVIVVCLLCFFSLFAFLQCLFPLSFLTTHPHPLKQDHQQYIHVPGQNIARGSLKELPGEARQHRTIAIWAMPKCIDLHIKKGSCLREASKPNFW